MKMIGIKDAKLDRCIDDAQHERVVITRNGSPVALIIGVEGLDDEQLQLGSNSDFWKLIEQRRQQKSIKRAELEKRFTNTN